MYLCIDPEVKISKHRIIAKLLKLYPTYTSEDINIVSDMRYNNALSFINNYVHYSEKDLEYGNFLVKMLLELKKSDKVIVILSSKNVYYKTIESICTARKYNFICHI